MSRAGMLCGDEREGVQLQGAESCERQGICGVVGSGSDLETQHVHDHVPYLILGGLPVPRDCGFQLERGGFDEGNVMFGKRKEDASPRLGHVHGGGFVLGEEEAFHHGEFGLHVLKELPHILMDLLKAAGGIRRWFCGNRKPIYDVHILGGIGINNTDSNGGKSRIYSQDAHTKEHPSFGEDPQGVRIEKTMDFCYPKRKNE